MTATVNVNGRITDEGHAVIPVFDHGFLYGEGVYETLRTYHGRPFQFGRHMARLRRSAGMMRLAVPLSDSEMSTRIGETLSAGALDGEAYIRVLVTRGIGDLTYDLAATPTPSVVIIVKPHVAPPAEVYERGVRVVIVDIVRNHPRSVNPAIKSNNLMNSALAMQEALRRGGAEGIMRNHRGELSECSVANLFVVTGGAALTPPLDAGILPGITREVIFEIGPGAGVPVREARLMDEDLFGADEVFLTSTTRELVPVVQVDERTIGNGRPGAATKALLDRFRRLAEET